MVADPPKRVLNALQASAYGSGSNDHRTMTKVKIVGQGFNELDDISEMVMLRRIELDRNAIRTLHGLRDNSDLEYVSASGCELAQLVPEDLMRWSKLKFLNVSNNDLAQIEGLPKFADLVALLLSQNKLRQLPRLKGLKSLKTLVVSHNELEDVSDCAWAGLKALETFSASHNRLSSLPKAFAALHELTKLRLNDNRFTAVPEAVESNAKLELVDFGRNKIATFEALRPLQALPVLQQLNLRGNPLCDRDDYADTIRAMFPALKTLDSRPLNRTQPATTGRRLPAIANRNNSESDVDDAIDFEAFVAKEPEPTPEPKPAAAEVPAPVKTGVVAVVVKKVASAEQSRDAVLAALDELRRQSQVGLGVGSAWDQDSDQDEETPDDAVKAVHGPPKKKRRRQKKAKAA